MSTHPQVETVSTGADKAKLAAAAVLLVGGVAAFYLLSQQSLWLRVLALLAQLQDAGLEKGLVVLGGVVLGVLFEVAIFARDGNLRCDLWAFLVLELLDLGFEFVVCGL